MKSILAITALALMTTGCSTLNWERDEDGPRAQDMDRAECGLGGAHTPAGPGDWVCETNGDTHRQTQNPVYPAED